uniref:Phospholipid-transporting ATPase n=1 Tax=Piliocolobus tephrosceles TaxID=591936 RepID=A0A8C9HIR2_9PRIM
MLKQVSSARKCGDLVKSSLAANIPVRYTQGHPSHRLSHLFSEHERYLQANNKEFNSIFVYPNNTIKTSKYSVFNFLPLNLFEQFQRLANAYFLILLFLQLIPQISSLTWYTTMTPLIVVLSITAVKDAIDDLVKADIQRLFSYRMKEDKWMNVQVGDIIKLENNQPVTVSTSFGCDLCRTLIPSYTDAELLLHFSAGEVRCEAPNNKLDRFSGILTYKGKNYFLDHDKLLLRGCIIRNTDWCYGLVIYTGPDTKLMQNSGKSTFKRTQIDHLMNVLVLWIFLGLGIICFVLAVGHGIWQNKKGYYFQIFLPWEKYVSSSAVSAILIFWSYFIILNTMVPISLYVSVEIIRLGNSLYINWDRKMFYAPRNTPAQARTTTLNEELGQVKYVFSDKTGTLTQNIMIFNKCSINGKLYGMHVFLLDDKSETPKEKVDFSYNKLADPKFSFYDKTLVEAVKKGDHWVHLFFRSLSLCHTVMSEEKVEGMLVYQAQSPDEGALVTAARNFGFVFRSRTSETVIVVEMGKTRVYQLLTILDFNNVRKRMSVIVQTPEDRIMLFCKGADTIICELLHPSCSSLCDAAGEGRCLRTLMVAYRELDEAFFQDWSKRHTEACLSLENRESRLSSVYEEVEKDLMLLGVTAIEDKLQDGVPETIIILNKAKIRLWVLTGDKQETAVNIAYSCNLFEDEMDEVFVVEGRDDETIRKELRYRWEISHNPVNIYLTTKPKLPFEIPEEVANGNYGLIIDGYSLAYALEGNLELELLRTACMCKGVICCRMTPLQKAQVVELMKRYKKVVTLAIGDGANDVSMIKAAHIGVGISGQEGLQAMLNSDFAFSQFQYLQRLLLVHGRWSYNRMCKFLSYFFYKNFTFTLVHFWYAFFNGFSAQIALRTTYWTMISHVVIWGSLGFYFCMLFLLYSDGLCLAFPDVFQFLGKALPSGRRVGNQVYLFNKCLPRSHYYCRRLPRQSPVQTKLKHSSTRRSAYAFSHKHGFGALITSGKTVKSRMSKKNTVFSKR